MSETWQRYQVIGAYGAWTGNAPFARLRAVLESQDWPGNKLILGPSREATEPRGEEISEKDWENLLTQQEVLTLDTPVTAQPGVAVWILRQALGSHGAKLIESLREAGPLLSQPQWGPEQAAACVVVEEQGAIDARRQLAERAFNQAWQAAEHGTWTEAVREGAIAFYAAIRWEVQPTALYCITLERSGEAKRAEGLAAVARNDLGAKWAERLEEERRRYRSQFVDASSQRAARDALARLGANPKGTLGRVLHESRQRNSGRAA